MQLTNASITSNTNKLMKLINCTAANATTVNNSVRLFKKLLLGVFVFLSLAVGEKSWGQTPTNGGFEATISAATDWTTSGAAGTTNARTGVNALAHTTSSASNVPHTNVSTINIPNNNYAHVIGWAIGSNANARASCGGSLNAVAGSTAIATIGTTLTQLTYDIQNISGSTQTFSGRVNTRSVSGSLLFIGMM